MRLLPATILFVLTFLSFFAFVAAFIWMIATKDTVPLDYRPLLAFFALSPFVPTFGLLCIRECERLQRE